MRLDLSVNDLEKMRLALSHVAFDEGKTLEAERRKKSPTPDDAEYAKYVEDMVATARAGEANLVAAVDAAKRLTVISVEIRPPDATYAVRGNIIHPAHRLDLTIADLELIVNGLLKMMRELDSRIARSRKRADGSAQMDQRELDEVQEIFRRVDAFYSAIRKLPVSSAEVAPASTPAQRDAPVSGPKK